jgi:hypothetical protein
MGRFAAGAPAFRASWLSSLRFRAPCGTGPAAPIWLDLSLELPIERWRPAFCPSGHFAGSGPPASCFAADAFRSPDGFVRIWPHVFRNTCPLLWRRPMKLRRGAAPRLGLPKEAPALGDVADAVPGGTPGWRDARKEGATRQREPPAGGTAVRGGLARGLGYNGPPGWARCPSLKWSGSPGSSGRRAYR